MRVGGLTKRVRLYRGPQATNDADGWGEALTPATAWCAIQPQGSLGDGRTTTSVVTMRWHPQMSVDAVLVYADPVQNRDRLFSVRGVRNIDERNEMLMLDCDEVQP